MKRSLLFLLSFFCFHVLAHAQDKKADSCCQPYEYKWYNLGGQLTIRYDGERLRLVLVARFADTNSLVKTFIKKKNAGQWFIASMGKMMIGEREVNIQFNSDDITYEVHDHQMQLTVMPKEIPLVVNGEQWLDILMTNFSPDSTVFICTGKEAIEEVQPEPASFTKRQASWMSTDSNRYSRHCEYAIVLGSSDKGLFGFSRLTIRKLNDLLSGGFMKATSYLIILVAFWYIWYVLLAGRAYFEKVNAKLVYCVIKWVPWMGAFYLVIVWDNFISSAQIADSISGNKKSALSEVRPLTWRIALVVTAVILFIFQRFWRRKAHAPRAVLVKTLCKTFAGSMFAFVLLGVLIQCIDHCIGAQNPFVDVHGYVGLEVTAPYAVAAITLFYGYLVFVLYKLFAFNRRIQFIVILLTIVFAFKEPYRIMGEGEMVKTEHSISFNYPIKPIGELETGSLDLSMSFANQADMFFIIPLLLTVSLIVQLRRRKDQQKTMVLMASLFFVFYCCYLTNIKETFLLFPVTLVAAVVLNRLIMVRDKRVRLQLIQAGNQLYNQELNDIKVFRNMPEYRKSVKLKELYRQRLLDGVLLPADYEKAVADLNKLIGEPGVVNIQRRMEFGPYREPLRNGLTAMGYGLLVSALIYLVYFKFYLIETNYEVAGIPHMFDGDATRLIVKHFFPILLHGMAAFCLGYFFPFLRGNSGWEKGAWLGAAIGLAHVPVVYCTVENAGWSPLAGVFFKHVIILMITGFMACDLVTIRKIFGRNHSWKEVIHVMGWKKTITLGAFVMTAVGSGITSWISENVLVALKSFLNN